MIEGGTDQAFGGWSVEPWKEGSVSESGGIALVYSCTLVVWRHGIYMYMFCGFLLLYPAYSYIQFIKQRMHPIKYNEIQITENNILQVPNSYMLRRRKSTRTKVYKFNTLI